MKFEDKREIWDAIIECAKHSPLTAPTKLAEELLAAHKLVWGEEPQCSPRMPLTAKEVEAAANPAKKDNGPKDNFYYNLRGERVNLDTDRETCPCSRCSQECDEAGRS